MIPGFDESEKTNIGAPTIRSRAETQAPSRGFQDITSGRMHNRLLQAIPPENLIAVARVSCRHKEDDRNVIASQHWPGCCGEVAVGVIEGYHH